MNSCIHLDRNHNVCNHPALQKDLFPTFTRGPISEESLRLAAEYRKLGMLILLAKHPINVNDTEAFCDALDNQEVCEGFSPLLASQRARR